MSYRRKARECALQMLFQLDMTADDEVRVRRQYWSSNPVPDPVKAYADRLVQGVSGHRDEIDTRLTEVAQNWRLDRMATVDRSVLRVAVYELMFEADTPHKVAINEAIEISKKFGSDTSGNFVNGVLDGIKRDLEAVGRPTS